jgi:hypothetical protein
LTLIGCSRRKLRIEKQREKQILTPTRHTEEVPEPEVTPEACPDWEVKMAEKAYLRRGF